jgi:hypothetical protein
MRPLVLTTLALAAACAPKQLGVVPINTSALASDDVVWVYLDTSDDSIDGIYRCRADEQGRPVCEQAKLERQHR